jgi:hypothetical protein
MNMKILAVVIIVFILVLAWTQNRTFQNSTQVKTVNQDLDESAGLQQSQENQNSQALAAPSVNQKRQATIQTSGVKPYSSPAMQRSAQAMRKSEQSNQAQANKNTSAGAQYNQQRQTQNQRYNQQRYNQQRPGNAPRYGGDPKNQSSRSAYTGNQPSQRPVGKQQGFAYEGGSVSSAGSHNEHVRTNQNQAASQRQQTVAGSREPGVYSGGYSQQADNRPYQSSTPANQPPGNVGSPQSASQPIDDQSAYQKGDEPTNCIYRDGRVYCR